MSDNCPECGKPMRCFGGASAHPSNWYCSDEQGCGYQAWTKKDKTKLPDDLRRSLIAPCVENADNLLLSNKEYRRSVLEEGFTGFETLTDRNLVKAFFDADLGPGFPILHDALKEKGLC